MSELLLLPINHFFPRKNTPGLWYGQPMENMLNTMCAPFER